MVTIGCHSYGYLAAAGVVASVMLTSPAGAGAGVLGAVAGVVWVVASRS